MARKSAEQRREEIVEIAFRHFAEGGYNGTSTEAIAREAGISQPYLFRLFRTKRELFLACVGPLLRAGRRRSSDEAAADAADEERLHGDGPRLRERLLPDRHALLFQMQAYAVSEPEIRAYVREGYQELVRTVAELAGVEVDATWEFFATGMLLNVMADARHRLVAPSVREIGYLGLGSNVGDRRTNLQATVELLWAHDVVVLVSSSVYETEPVGEVLDQRPFYNACLRVETALEPEPLLDACKAVERAFGRMQAGEDGYVKHGPRAIDVDVLLLGDASTPPSG